MRQRIILTLWALAALALLAGCGSAATPAASAPTPAARSPLRAATAAPAATAASKPATGAIPEGVTAEGYHTRGAPDAPVTLVMYSDFL